MIGDDEEKKGEEIKKKKSHSSKSRVWSKCRGKGLSARSILSLKKGFYGERTGFSTTVQ